MKKWQVQKRYKRTVKYICRGKECMKSRRVHRAAIGSPSAAAGLCSECI